MQHGRCRRCCQAQPAARPTAPSRPAAAPTTLRGATSSSSSHRAHHACGFHELWPVKTKWQQRLTLHAAQLGLVKGVLVQVQALCARQPAFVLPLLAVLRTWTALHPSHSRTQGRQSSVESMETISSVGIRISSSSTVNSSSHQVICVPCWRLSWGEARSAHGRYQIAAKAALTLGRPRTCHAAWRRSFRRRGSAQASQQPWTATHRPPS